ncbi:NepR family anti-sigma factor [Methylobacterium sp. 88A]|uniref:NepR family anti-sigma factor n=1 Tax=Methylobacterium sp. 88A TaxID=1131813 RepID=UPI0003760604|nr:NepR family anti-sigma factor [Methylobacterium sp. 88A]
MTIDASDIHGPFEVLDAGKRASGSHATGGEASSSEAASLACPAAAGARAGMDTESRRRIGRNLRILYGDVLNLPLPDRFKALLTELSAKPASRETS